MICARPVVERDVEIVDIGADSAGLRLIGGCRGCGGCAGRCGLLDAAESGLARLQLTAFPTSPLPGERWRLSLDESSLREAAAWGYGLPLIGMLAGALLGWLLGLALDSSVNVTTLLGAIAGTSLALRQSKRCAPPALPIASRVMDAAPAQSDNPSALSAADPQPSKEF